MESDPADTSSAKASSSAREDADASAERNGTTGSADTSLYASFVRGSYAGFFSSI